MEKPAQNGDPQISTIDDDVTDNFSYSFYNGANNCYFLINTVEICRIKICKLFLKMFSTVSFLNLETTIFKSKMYWTIIKSFYKIFTRFLQRELLGVINSSKIEKKTLFVIAFKTWLLSYTAVVFEVASFAGNPGCSLAVSKFAFKFA